METYKIEGLDENHMENTEDIQVILADRQEVLWILRQERVYMRCGLMLMQF